jgi:hypothetical protein
MKKLLIFVFILSLYANDTKEILQLIEIIKHKTPSYREINDIYNPFEENHHKTKSTNKISKSNDKVYKSNETYNLQVIFDNKLKINNQWYKIGDKIDNYKIVKKNDKFMLINNKKVILLSNPTIIKVQ